MVLPRGHVLEVNNDDEAPEYRPRIEEEPDSPVEGGELRKAKSTDKIAIPRWDKMNEAERKDYEEAWLKKGAREREGERVYRSRGSAGEGSSAGAPEAGSSRHPGGRPGYETDEAPEFTDEDEEVGKPLGTQELGESSGTSGVSQQEHAN